MTDYSSDWEIEYCGTEDEAWARESFNQLISFVMNSSDEDFREHIGEYLDVDAAVDYLLYIYALGVPDSAAKDLVMLWYGDRWIPSAFDLDEAFGLDADEARYREVHEFLPAFTGEQWDSGTESLLWDRLLNLFTDEIILRYHSLREGPLAEDRMIDCVKAFIGQIPERFYDLDFYRYPERPMQDLHMDGQIVQYISERMKILDEIWEVDAE